MDGYKKKKKGGKISIAPKKKKNLYDHQFRCYCQSQIILCKLDVGKYQRKRGKKSLSDHKLFNLI